MLCFDSPERSQRTMTPLTVSKGTPIAGHAADQAQQPRTTRLLLQRVASGATRLPGRRRGMSLMTLLMTLVTGLLALGFGLIVLAFVGMSLAGSGVFLLALVRGFWYGEDPQADRRYLRTSLSILG